MFYRKSDWAISPIIVVALISALPYLSLAADSPAGNPSSLNPDNGKSLAEQMKTIRVDLEQLGTRKAVLWDQVSGLRTQKQIARLNARLQDLL